MKESSQETKRCPTCGSNQRDIKRCDTCDYACPDPWHDSSSPSVGASEAGEPTPEFAWDDDNYPTDATLETIKKWRGDDFKDFFALLKPIWMYSSPGGWCGWHEADEADEFDEQEISHRYHLSTGGWSGNESLIDAMQSNFVLWSLTWVQQRRGGHYIFSCDRKRVAEPSAESEDAALRAQLELPKK